MARSLGEVVFTVGADTRPLRGALKDIAKFSRRVHEVGNVQTRSSDKSVTALKRQAKAMTVAFDRASALQKELRRTNYGRGLIEKTNEALHGYVGTLSDGVLSTEQMGRANKKFKSTLGKVASAVKKADTATKHLKDNNKSAAFSFKDLSSAAVLINGPLGGIASRISALSGVIKRGGLNMAFFLGGLAGMSLALGKIVKSSFGAGREMQRLEQQFLAVTGTVKGAQDKVTEIIGIARMTGQAIKAIGKPYADWTAAIKGTIFEGVRGNKVFITMAKTISKLQLPAGDAVRVFKAMRQMVSKSTISMEELKNQLGDSLPGAINIAARAMGILPEELRKLSKAGKITTDEFLPKFAAELKRTFNIVEGKPIKNLETAFNNLNTAVFQTSAKLDKMLGITAIAEAFTRKMTKAVDYLRTHLEDILPIMGAVAGAMLGLAAPGILSALGAAANAIGTMTRAMGALNLVIMANPIGGLASLLVRLGLAASGAAAGYALLNASARQNSNVTKSLIEQANAIINVQKAARNSVRETTNVLITQLSTQIKVIATQVALLNTQAIKAKSVFAKTNFAKGLGAQFSHQIKARTEELSKLKDKMKELQDLKNKQGSSEPLGSGLLGPRKDFTEGLYSSTGHTLAADEFKAAMDKIRAAGEGGAEFDAGMKKFASGVSRLSKGGGSSGAIRGLADDLYGLSAIAKTVTKDVGAAFDKLADNISKDLLDGKLSVQTFTKAAKGLMQKLIADMIKMTVMAPLKKMFGSMMQSMVGGASGSGSGGSMFGGFKFFAKGGVVNSPTPFTMGGNSGGIGIAGEAGPEAILPLRRGKGGQLGVANFGGGGSGQTTTITNNFYVTSPDADSFQQSESQISTMLNRMSARGQRDL